MEPLAQPQAEFAPDEMAGADVIGGVVLGGVMSLAIWAALISFFVL